MNISARDKTNGRFARIYSEYEDLRQTAFVHRGDGIRIRHGIRFGTISKYRKRFVASRSSENSFASFRESFPMGMDSGIRALRRNAYPYRRQPQIPRGIAVVGARRRNERIMVRGFFRTRASVVRAKRADSRNSPAVRAYRFLHTQRQTSVDSHDPDTCLVSVRHYSQFRRAYITV